jgi:uncharacterized tellurite resistance protein B-like protein
MIAFATVDGHLHKKEYDFFLFLIANAFEIEREALMIYFIKRKSNNTIRV